MLLSTMGNCTRCILFQSNWSCHTEIFCFDSDVSALPLPLRTFCRYRNPVWPELSYHTFDFARGCKSVLGSLHIGLGRLLRRLKVYHFKWSIFVVIYYQFLKISIQMELYLLQKPQLRLHWINIFSYVCPTQYPNWA